MKLSLILFWQVLFPHETKIFNNPPWINNKMKTMIQEKSIISFIWKI